MRFIRHLVSATAGLALLLAAVGAAAAEHEHADHAGGADEKGGRLIQVVSTLVGGKNVFIPSTLVVAAGEPARLSIFNTTDKPHGFRIPDLGIEVVLLPQQETEVQLPRLEGGRVHEINCHLHPPHRNATLAVLPAP